MKEDLISFDTAKLAKEKGFNIECLHFYTKPQSKMFGIDEHGRSYPIKNKSKSLYVIGEHTTLNIKSVFYAPSQSLLQKWLREVHGIHIEVLLSENHPYNEFYIRIMNIGKYFTLSHEGIYSKNYEEVLEIGLQEGLKLIKDGIESTEL